MGFGVFFLLLSSRIVITYIPVSLSIGVYAPWGQGSVFLLYILLPHSKVLLLGRCSVKVVEQLMSEWCVCLVFIPGSCLCSACAWGSHVHGQTALWHWSTTRSLGLGLGECPRGAATRIWVSERSQWLLAVKWRDFPFRFGLMSWSCINPRRLLFTKWRCLPESSRVLLWGCVCLQSTERTNEMTYCFIFCPRNSCSYWHTFCFWGWDCFSQFGVRGKCSNVFINRQQLLPSTMLFHRISHT